MLENGDARLFRLAADPLRFRQGRPQRVCRESQRAASARSLLDQRRQCLDEHASGRNVTSARFCHGTEVTWPQSAVNGSSAWWETSRGLQREGYSAPIWGTSALSVQPLHHSDCKVMETSYL